jgi:DNA alkylation damage repair protein AlkB
MQGHTRDLFAGAALDTRHEWLALGAWLLRGFALDKVTAVLAAIESITAAAPFRHWVTPGGFRMSVAMTNCGSVGWVSDRRGYRYDARDPLSGRPWPPMPPVFLELARDAAQAAGFAAFEPDACLVNHYTPGARLTLHQDRDEGDFSARPSCPCRSACPRLSSSAATPEPTSGAGCLCSTATSWSGAALRACIITACWRSKTATTSYWAPGG